MSSIRSASFTDAVIPAFLLLAVAIVALNTPIFFSLPNLANIFLQASVIGIVSLGMTPVIISGDIDLSVGGVVALSGIVLAKICGSNPLGFSAIFAALLVALVCGLANGLAVTHLKVPSFIATLGMMGITRGIALLISNGEPLSSVGSISRFLGAGSLLNIPFPIWIFVATMLPFYIALRHSVFGIRLYAIGGNKTAAWIAGINISAYTIGVFCISELFAGIAGVVLAGRLGSAQPLAGNLYELDAITAAVLGGATLAGGRGGAIGTALGALLLAAIRNAMVIANMSVYLQPILIGTLLIVVLFLNHSRKNQQRS